MNIDRILQTMSAHAVDFLLIGGVNFMLRHEPVLTYDVDLWIEDSADNLRRCEAALAELQAEWGKTDEDWGPVAAKQAGWLERQAVYCLTSPHGSIDVFRAVRGLRSWSECRERAVAVQSPAGVDLLALCDQDMLQCQLALPEGERNARRVDALKKALGEGP